MVNKDVYIYKSQTRSMQNVLDLFNAEDHLHNWINLFIHTRYKCRQSPAASKVHSHSIGTPVHVCIIYIFPSVSLCAWSAMSYQQYCKGKGLGTCYSATYMSQTRAQQRFTISEVAADWHEPMVPQRIMWPSIARANWQLDPRCSYRPNHPR